MKNKLQIVAAIDHPELLEHAVEKLATGHYDLGYGKQHVPGNNEAIETSSTAVKVTGIVAIDNLQQLISVPFTTGFVFTCIKGKDNGYKLTWSSSLS